MECSFCALMTINVMPGKRRGKKRIEEISCRSLPVLSASKRKGFKKRPVLFEQTDLFAVMSSAFISNVLWPLKVIFKRVSLGFLMLILFHSVLDQGSFLFLPSTLCVLIFSAGIIQILFWKSQRTYTRMFVVF